MHDRLARYEDLLRRIAKAVKTIADIDAEIAILDRQTQIEGLVTQSHETRKDFEVESFIEEHRRFLGESDIEFLSKPSRSTSEVVQHTKIPSTSLRRLGKAGVIRREKLSERKHQYCTTSVMRFVIQEQMGV